MGKNAIYGVLIVAGLAGLIFYAYPKYKQATGQTLPAAAANPNADKGARKEGF